MNTNKPFRLWNRLPRIRQLPLPALLLQNATAWAGSVPDATPEPNRTLDRISPAEFSDPPAHVRPGCFWDWLNGAMTTEQITRDLEAMKQAGMPTTVGGPMDFHAELPLPALPKNCPRDARGKPVYLRGVAVLAVPHDKAKSLAGVDRVVDLTQMADAAGNLRWKVPAGDWDILRFVCMNHGQA